MKTTNTRILALGMFVLCCLTIFFSLMMMNGLPGLTEALKKTIGADDLARTAIEWQGKTIMGLFISVIANLTISGTTLVILIWLLVELRKK